MAKDKHQDQPQIDIEVETHTESHVSSGSVNDERVEEITNDLKRVQAEFINYKRRVEEEKREVLEFAKTKVVREFLSVRDTFDQEAAHRPADVDPKWAASIDAVRAQFDAVLTSLGVERFDSLGQPFDPRRHNAVMMEDGEGEHEVVTDELQPGYQIGDTVLRPAMVKVGYNDEMPSQENTADKARQ
jgi:molecular chaperone GrpE